MSKNLFLQDLFSEKISEPHNQLLEITFSQNVFKMVKNGNIVVESDK